MMEIQSYNKTRVLFVNTNLGGGGAERVLSSLLWNIDRNKFEPGLVLFINKLDYSIPQDIQIFCLDKKRWSDYPKLVWKLARIYRRWKPDIAISLLYYPNNIAILAKILSRSKIKVILSEHGMPSFPLSKSRDPITYLFIKWLPRFLYKKADKVVCVSQNLADEVRYIYKLPSEDIKIIYNPIDTDKISQLSAQNIEHPWFGEKIPIIINVSNLTLAKGHVYLLKAFKQVLAKLPCRLVILGEGKLENSLKQLTPQLGIQNEVAFLGFQSNPFKYLAHSTIFALSSLSEVFPMVILEAMCCGLPIISTSYPGSSEIITGGVNGLLVPPANEEALAKAIVTLLGNKDYAARLARAGREKVNEFEARKITKIYENCLGGL